MVHNLEYTCYNAKKDIRKAIELINKVTATTNNNVLKGSLRHITGSLEQIAKNAVYQFRIEDEQTTKGLFD